MAADPSASIPAWRLDALRTELADLAYELERQRRTDAADVVNMLGIRLGELADDGEPSVATSHFSPDEPAERLPVSFRP